MLELSSVSVDETLRPLRCRTTVCGDILAESLNVFESTCSEPRLDYFHPGADTIYLLSNLLPLENPRTVDPVASGRTGHAIEAFEVMPSLEFFEFGLINQLLVLDDLFLREVVAIPLDDSLEFYFL